MSNLQHRVEQFLYREACLMDENRYEDWLALFTEDCLYWIPSNQEGADPTREVSILYGDYAMLENHVRRLSGGKAFAQSPPSRMRRIVANVEVDTANDTGEIEAAANFVVFEIRLHAQRLHAGRSVYRLIEQNGDLAIRYKQINLVGIDEPQENITFLL